MTLALTEVTVSVIGPGAAVAVTLEGTVIAADPSDMVSMPEASVVPSASVRV